MEDFGMAIFCGNGEKISTVCFSTVLGIDGRGILGMALWNPYYELLQTVYMTRTTVIGKSSTRYRHEGNFIPWNPLTWNKFVQKFGDDGMVNNYGLTNPGVEKTSNAIAESAKRGVHIIPNIFPFFREGKESAANHVCDSVNFFRDKMGENFRALEVSYSCPNTEECIPEIMHDALWCTERVKAYAPDLVVIAKISVMHPPRFAYELGEAGADVIHSANSIPWDNLFDGESPLSKYGRGNGAVTGGPAFEAAYRYNSEVAERFSGSIIFGCGIVDDEKLDAYLKLARSREGSNILTKTSLSLCTAGRRRPKWAKAVALEYNS